MSHTFMQKKIIKKTKPANKSQVESQINFTFLLVILSLNLSTTNKPVTIGLF